MRLAVEAAFVILVIIVATFIAIYKITNNSRTRPKVEYDISKTPGFWFAFSREAADGFTEVGIQYVAKKDGRVMERRTLERLDTDAGDYAKRLDAAQDHAYEAQRVANLGLTRR